MLFNFESFEKVLVCEENEDPYWRPSLFSHVLQDPTGNYLYYTIDGRNWYHCLPYEEFKNLCNEKFETKHVEGINEEFEFGEHVEVRDNASEDWVKAIFIYDKNKDEDSKSTFKYVVAIEGTPSSEGYKYCKKSNW